MSAFVPVVMLKAVRVVDLLLAALLVVAFS
jgi:hypothetical protein